MCAPERVHHCSSDLISMCMSNGSDDSLERDGECGECGGTEKDDACDADHYRQCDRYSV